MKKKNVLTIVVCIALAAVLAVGATLAYFTSHDDVKNTFTMGNVAINLQEKKSKDTAWGDGPLSFENLMPLDTADKMAQVVINDGSADCYVRVTMALKVLDGSTLTADDLDEIYANVVAAIADTSDDWTVEETKVAGHVTGLTCDYNEVASAGDVLSLFDAIEIPNLGNNAQNQSFSLVLNAYAVQSANVDITTFVWNEEDFT